MNQLSHNRNMITLNPPLAVVGNHSEMGFVHNLGPKSLRIIWTQGKVAQGSILVTLADKRPYTLMVRLSDNEIYETSDEPSHQKLVDLLHVVRKNQHIALCAHDDVEGTDKNNGFSEILLPTIALPELSWEDIDTKRSFMGRTFAAPLLITGMTGGVDQGTMINERLAAAATAHKIPMGVGSQRMALENSEHAAIFALKRKFPKLFLVGNLGIGQLRSPNYMDQCRRAVEMIDADALAIHVNVLQELIQIEGDRDFRGLLDHIGNIARNLGVPVLVKEVGAGFDTTSVKALVERGVKHIDVGGRGGTSWARIEGLRSDKHESRRLGDTFRDWGIPTAKSLKNIMALGLNLEVVATGGIRDGVTALKALYLGATMAGVGLPLFKAALQDQDGPSAELKTIITELKIAMICTGTSRLDSLGIQGGNGL